MISFSELGVVLASAPSISSFLTQNSTSPPSAPSPALSLASLLCRLTAASSAFATSFSRSSGLKAYVLFATSSMSSSLASAGSGTLKDSRISTLEATSGIGRAMPRAKRRSLLISWGSAK